MDYTTPREDFSISVGLNLTYRDFIVEMSPTDSPSATIYVIPAYCLKPTGADDWRSNMAAAVDALAEQSGRIERRLITLESQLHYKRHGSSMLKRMMPVINLLAILGLVIANIIKVRE